MPVELIIGVVGLTVQIMDASTKIMDMFETYKNGSHEIRRLVSKVDRAKTMCAHIKKLFEQESDFDSSEARLNAKFGANLLHDIQATLNALGETCIGFQKKARDKRPSVAKWAWLVKQDRTRQLMDDLDKDLVFLTQAMSVNTYSHVSVIRQILSDDTTSATRFTDTDLVTVQPPESHHSITASFATSSPNEPKTEIRARQGARGKQWLMSFYTISKHGKIIKTIQWKNGLQTETISETRNFTLGHPLFARKLEITYRISSFCQPYYALSMPRIIECGDWPWDDPPFARELRKVFYKDDLTKLQTMISQGRITPNTKLRIRHYSLRPERDTLITLFDYGIKEGAVHICYFLAAQDSSFIMRDEQEHAWPSLYPSRGEENVQDLLSLLEPGFRLSDPVNLFKFLAGSTPDPSLVLRWYEYCKALARNRLGDLIHEARPLFFRSWRSDIDESQTQAIAETWIPVLRRIIDDHSDLHKNEVWGPEQKHLAPPNHPYHVVGNIFPDGKEDPLDWEDRLFSWIKAITACGINPSECLEYETELHMGRQPRSPSTRNWRYRNSSPVRSTVVIRTVYGFKIPTWEMKAVTDGPANEVCIEFSSLGAYLNFEYGSDLWLARWDSFLESEHPHRIWKFPLISGYEPWPFTSGLMANVEAGICAKAISPLNLDERSQKMAQWFGYTKEGQKFLTDSYLRALDLRKERFRRRQRRKERGNGTWRWPRKKRKNAMPGSWVDG